jgi:hypothetical protein
MDDRSEPFVELDLHERAEAALGWVDEEASDAGPSSPAWAEQACEELSAASGTGMLLGRRDGV